MFVVTGKRIALNKITLNLCLIITFIGGGGGGGGGCLPGGLYSSYNLRTFAINCDDPLIYCFDYKILQMNE